MVENIEKFSERGENLKILIEKSEALVPAVSSNSTFAVVLQM